jgi:serine/threonine protein kinase
MGVVFQAEDVHLQRTVALKVILPEIAEKPAAQERFLREARASAKVEHDNIVAIYQVSEDRGVPFMAMPLLKGVSLEDFLRQRARKQPGAPLSLSEILKIGREIARGLAKAHESGLIHRDIKPANIWLDSAAGGRVKILDFGLARPAAEEGNLTQAGGPFWARPRTCRPNSPRATRSIIAPTCSAWAWCSTGSAPELYLSRAKTPWTS